MAVYEGARRIARPLVPPRRQRTVRVRAHRGTSRVGLTLAAILVVFLLALFYLTQTLGVAALNYDIDTLIAERSAIEQQLQSVEGDIARWGAEPAIVKGAQQAGLDRLGDGVRIPAR